MPDRVDNHSLDHARALSEMQQLLLETQNITSFLEELARYAAEAIGPGLSCGITMDRDGGPLTVASSDAHARTLDEVQYDHHGGPCLTAMRTRTTITITDLATDDRWGAYQIDALAHGIGSALAIPISAGSGVRGALNLYAARTNMFTTTRHARAEALGAEASRTLRLALRVTDQIQLTHNLETAMASRSIIDQAIGIIMGQNRCPATEAFDILRAASNHRNIKLRDIANEIITRISGTPPHPRPPPD